MKTEIESKQLLGRYGIATTAPQLATSKEQAEAIVRGIGRPCALKIVSAEIVHKVAAGGVRLGIEAAGAGAAYEDILSACRQSHPAAALDGVLVEEMVPQGREIFIGGRLDPAFGIVVLLGPGGSGVEQGRKPLAALAPLEKSEASALIASAFPDWSEDGGRVALLHCLMAVAGPAGLLINEPIVELDINPVIVKDDRAIAVDAVVGMAEDAKPAGLRTVAETEAALSARRARLQGLRSLFDPKAIAFVGASTSKDKLGYHLISNMLAFGFKGEIHPIHPTAKEICGRKAYPSVSAIPSTIDRAYIAVGGQQVPDVLAECRAKGVTVAQVLSAGFSEYTDDAHDLEAAMLAQVSDGPMRMVGPNCIGTFSSTSRLAIGAARYNPTEPGGITVFAQSGTFAGDIVRRAQVWGLPVARVLSCGNCADLDPVDMLLWADADPDTEIVAFYMESLRDPGLFFRTVKAMSKPVVVLRGAMTDQGQIAASSHTAALATDRLLWEGAVAQSGLIVVPNVEDLMDALLVLTAHGRSPGSRLGIFGSGGGVSVTSSDAAARAGLTVAGLAPQTQAKLQRFSVPGTSVSNPVDIPVWGLRDGERYIYEEIINVLKDDPGIDRLVVFVEMGWVLDFIADDVTGIATLRDICASIARARPDGPPMSLALRSSGDRYQDDFVREMRPAFLAHGISVFTSVSRAVRAQAMLVQRSRADA